MLDYQFLKTNIFNIVNVDAQKVLDSIEDEEIADKDNPRKRKRLDNFTPQERMIRRKLKNRAAAQNARDRKKERMDQLEVVVSQLEIENKELKRSNEELRTNMHMLMSQNQQLLVHLKKNEEVESEKQPPHKRRVTDTDHTYFTKTHLSPCQLSSKLLVPDKSDVVIKKEEETEDGHAAEITDSPCFLNHDVANQSQIEQLFDVYEHGESGEDLEEDDSAQGGSQTEAEKFEGNSSPLTDEPSSYTREICKEQTDELFELCEEIQNIVGQVQQDSLINLSATYTDISSLNTGNSLATENPLESIDNSLTVTNDSLASIENSLTNTDNSLTDNSLTDIDNSLTDIDNSLTDTDNSLINIIDNSLTITDNSNDPHVIGGIVERIYIDVEEESTVHAIGTSGGKESAETLPVSICNEMNLFGGETDDVTSHEYGKTSDLIAAEDLLNEFDYILNSYGTSNVLKDNTITSSSPGDNLGVGEEWDDLLSDLFPSLSSL